MLLFAVKWKLSRKLFYRRRDRGWRSRRRCRPYRWRSSPDPSSDYDCCCCCCCCSVSNFPVMRCHRLPAFRCGLKQWSRRQRRNRVRQILTQHRDAAPLKVRRRRPTSCLVIGRSSAPRVVAWQRLLAQVPADEPIGRRQGVTGRFANTLNAAVRAGSAPNKCSNDRNGSVIRKTN